MRQYTPRFDKEWKEMIALLPAHRQAEMEMAIRQYQADGTEPTELEGAEAMAFMLIRKIVDRRKRQRDARRRKQGSATPESSGAIPDNRPMEKTEPETGPTTPQAADGVPGSTAFTRRPRKGRKKKSRAFSRPDGRNQAPRPTKNVRLPRPLGRKKGVA